MRIYYPNLADAYSAISASSAVSTLPVTNVTHFHKSRVWRTGTSVADEYITIDLGSSQAATAAIIFAHTLTAGDSAIQLRKSTDNFAANDVLVGTFTWSSGPMLLTFTSTSSRYWRIKFTKASAGVSRDIGRIFLGTYTTFTGLPDWDGFSSSPIDLSQTQVSEGGQDYTNQRSQYRDIRLDASGVSTAQAADIKTFTETVGAHTPFFLQADENATDESGEVFYVRLKKLPARDTDGMVETTLGWQIKLEAKEQL